MSWLSSIVTDQRINPAAWDAAWRTSTAVGRCDREGAPMVVVANGDDTAPWVTIGRHRWYLASCVICHHDMATLNGHVRPRSIWHGPDPTVRRGLRHETAG
jgi:hypothetical protein